MVKARLIKRNVYTPRGKLDKPTYDIYVGKQLRTPAVSKRMGLKIVKKLNNCGKKR